MNLLVLSLNHCHLGYLGCYGNQWIQTPAIDRLAAESLVCDQHFVENVETLGTHQGWWTGRHSFSLASSPVPAPGSTLAQHLSGAGVRTALISDAPSLFQNPSLLRGFADVIDLAGTPTTADVPPASHPLIPSAIEWLDRHVARDRSLLWLETDALRPPWQPPEPFASMYCDVDDEVASEHNEDEPDERELARYSYAAQLSHVDACAGELFDHLRNHGYDRNTAIILLSNRGIALGERGELGCEPPTLYEEFVHVPLIIRMPDGRGAATRTAALVQPVDLAPTLLDLFRVASTEPMNGSSLLPLLERATATVRDFAVSAVPGQAWSLRTPHWHLITPIKPGPAVPASREPTLPTHSHPSPQLYLKPEDRWDQHNVAALYPDDVERLTAMLEQFVQTISQRRTDELTERPPADTSPQQDFDHT